MTLIYYHVLFYQLLREIAEYEKNETFDKIRQNPTIFLQKMNTVISVH